MLSVFFHAVVVCLVCAGLVWTCRWVSRRSPLAGRVLVTALVIRTAAAMFFFWTSFLGLPFLERLQMGNGFWTIAPDAAEYFQLISRAATVWLYRDPYGRSVGYVATVGLWARAVGVNPASVLLFNLVLSVAIVAAIVAAFGRFRDRRAEWAAVASIAAFSFSPMFTFTVVQGLKDVFVVALIVAVAVAGTTLLTRFSRESALKDQLIALTVAAVSVWLVALTRNYLAMLIWASTAAACVFGALFAGRSIRARYVVRGTAVLLALGLAAFAGSDRFYRRVASEIVVNAARRAAYVWASRPQLTAAPANETASGPAPGISTPEHPPANVAPPATSTPGRPPGPSAVGSASTTSSPIARAAPPVAIPPPPPIFKSGLEEVEEARNGFTRTGGRTVLEDVAATSGRNRARALLSGMAAIFIPMSILQRLSIVTMPRQPGLLILADADTLFLDLTIVVIGWMLMRSRKEIDPGLAAFLVVLAMLTALPMAYVVTNYGTLIRLRLMIAAPLWLLPLSIAPGRGRPPGQK